MSRGANSRQVETPYDFVWRGMPYGFVWRGIEVVRAATHKGYSVLQIKTRRRILDVTITPSGLIRTKEHKL